MKKKVTWDSAQKQLTRVATITEVTAWSYTGYSYYSIHEPPTPFHVRRLPFTSAMFLTVRGVDGLGEEFRLPTCQGFYNIFHPVSRISLL